MKRIDYLALALLSIVLMNVGAIAFVDRGHYVLAMVTLVAGMLATSFSFSAAVNCPIADEYK
jgi:hypothetical protein